MAAETSQARPPWQAWAFLGLAVLLNLVLGSASAYSFVKIGFFNHFTSCYASDVPADDWWNGACWDETSLSSLYSWAVFGGFICVPAGLMFDKYGPRVTTAYGLVLVNVGIAGLIFMMATGGTPPVSLVGFFYLLEEQGGPSALYMVTVCVLVRVFPKYLIGVVSGAVAVAFGLSGLIWHKLAEGLFGFTTNAAPSETNLIGLFGLILALTDACGLALFFAAPRVFALVPSSDDASKEDNSKEQQAGADGQEKPSMRRTVISWNFACLIALYSVVAAQVIGMSSYLSSIPTAFSTLDSDAFSPISFGANVVGRIFYAVVVDSLTRYAGRTGVCAGNVWMNASYSCCFIILAAVAYAGDGPGWLICIAIFIGYAAYGGGVCFASSFTKLSFPEEHVGVVIGLLFTSAAIASTVFSAAFPVGNSQNSAGVDRVASDFVAPWTAGMVASFAALPIVVLVVARAARKGRRTREKVVLVAVRAALTGHRAGEKADPDAEVTTAEI